uniref:Testis-expressed sequence 2 protein n=1 Tax=Cajanus cajan TaxID=3821 RepID=A0A151RKP2_CAJCA|nr:Testis-expressed sequence 2 protein [Cajanus cajan]
MVLGLILVGFGLGVVAVVAAEALGLLWIMKRLRHKINSDEACFSSQTLATPLLDPQQSLDFAFRKQGVVWVLESGKISNLSRERKRKEILEVSPVKMYGQIKGQSLVLREPDGLHTTIELKGCAVQAVSASILSSRKWAKKFPIKVENPTSVIYNGSKTIYIYLDTSWEKEAWCKALYLASCDRKEKIKWFTQLDEEFHSYLTSLNSVYHSLMKPPIGSSVEVIERASKPDGSSSKVRQFLKKVAKRTSRVGLENISTWTSLSGNEGKKNTEKLHDSPLLSSKSSHSGSQSLHSVSSDADADEKFGIDEGTLCWNLLISRLFFDAKGNEQLKRSMLERIQKSLSNMRTPSYIGEVICNNINTGNVPPCITGMRVLPMEMREVWAVEVDIEYSGGALLEIETRLEVRELELQAGTLDSNPETNSAGDAPSDLLEGFEYIGKQFNFAERTNDLQEQKENGEMNTDVSKSFKSTMSSLNQGSRWKSILNSVAKQVSQVPLSLAIRVASLRGTLRLHIKPPPSDQLWYGFTSMPDIDFNLESSVGEHKITNTHFALFLVNRLKTGIRETLVLPNCESVCIPWMLAEKDDWVPRTVAPFIWINQEIGNETSTSIDTNNQPYEEVKASSSNSVTLESSSSLEELNTPLLLETTEQNMENNSESQSQHGSVVMEKRNHSIEQEDGLPKKMGRRERMLDLGKKMSEKLEEKRRHIEEKSRHIVEKMRGP